MGHERATVSVALGFKTIAMVLLSAGLLAACGKDRGTDESKLYLQPAPIGKINPGEAVTFAMAKQHVLEPFRCFECHSKWADETVLRSSSKRVIPGDPEASRIVQEIRSGSMPDDDGPRVSAEALALLIEYIKQLKIPEPPAPTPEPPTPTPDPGNPTPDPTPTPEPPTPPTEPVPDPVDPPTEVTFADIKQKVLEANRCLECHGKYKTEEGLLANKTRVVPGDPEGSRIVKEIRSGSMPDDDGPRVSEEALQLLIEYIKGLKKPE